MESGKLALVDGAVMAGGVTRGEDAEGGDIIGEGMDCHEYG